MVLCKLFDFLYFSIDDKDVTFSIHKGVSGNDIPNFITSVCKASFICGFLKTKCRHIHFNHNHRSRMCIRYSRLANYRLYGTPIKACKSIEAISCVRKYLVVTSGWPTLHCASYTAQSRSSSSAIAAIRLFSVSCAPSPPCETD